MEEMRNDHPWQDTDSAPAPKYGFPTGGKELVYSLLAAICGMMLCNFVLFGGFHLAFGIALSAYILCAAGYVLSRGGRLSFYSGSLLLLSIVIALGYGRSDDDMVKFLMLCVLTVSINLGLCLPARQNRRSPGGANSLLDAGYTVFNLGYGQLSRSFSGFFGALRGKGSLAKKTGSVLLGVLIMLPVLAIVLRLLTKADAAFEGMMDLMPEINTTQIMVTALCGTGVACILYTRGVALIHKPHRAASAPRSNKGINKLTVNTVLIGLCGVYLLYLFSQLAYFVSGFAGIVPQSYTAAEYARRGFFEMAWLCAINMGIIALAVSLVRKHEHRSPLSTRLLCLFIGLVTLFLVAAASAKMATYIKSYGLTRLRVTTQLIIVFFGITALTVCVNLFMKKPRYLPVLILCAMLLGGAAFWVDVDTLVASYNVTAYQHGLLKTVDMVYLSDLSDGAIPHIAKLTTDADPTVAEKARLHLEYRSARRKDLNDGWKDFRDWNYATAQADKYLPKE